MKIIISIYLISSMLLFSCANVAYLKRESIPATYLKQINTYGAKHDSEILLMNDEKVTAKKIEIAEDSLYLTMKELQRTWKISLTDVDWIKINDKKLGLGYGFFIGAGIGTIVGFGIGEGEEMGGIAVVGGIAVGGLLGSGLGYFLGGAHGYKFYDKNK